MHLRILCVSETNGPKNAIEGGHIRAEDEKDEEARDNETQDEPADPVVPGGVGARVVVIVVVVASGEVKASVSRS